MQQLLHSCLWAVTDLHSWCDLCTGIVDLLQHSCLHWIYTVLYMLYLNSAYSFHTMDPSASFYSKWSCFKIFRGKITYWGIITSHCNKPIHWTQVPPTPTMQWGRPATHRGALCTSRAWHKQVHYPLSRRTWFNISGLNKYVMLKDLLVCHEADSCHCYLTVWIQILQLSSQTIPKLKYNICTI